MQNAWIKPNLQLLTHELNQWNCASAYIFDITISSYENVLDLCQIGSSFSINVNDLDN